MRLTVLPGLMLLLAAFSAQAQNPTPFDCQITATLTATHLVSISYPNKGPAAPCIAWRLTYSTVNATGVSISLQGTTNLANGTADPAGWTNLTTPIGSTNPATGTNAGTIASCCDYYPWIRAIAGTFTGTSQTMSVSVLGYKGTSASRNTGGGGTGTVTAVTGVSPIISNNSSTTPAISLDKTLVAQKFFVTAPPTNIAGNLPGDLATDTTNHKEYVCNAPSGTAAPACTAVATAGWLLLNSSGGGGGNLTPVAFASIPPAATAGRVQMLTDSPYTAFDTGAAWQYFIQGKGQMTLPGCAGWAWDNQAASTTDCTHGPLYISYASAGGTELRVFEQATPAAPYAISMYTAFDIANAIGASSGVAGSVASGLCFSDGTGKILRFTAGYDTVWEVISQNWTNSTTVGIPTTVRDSAAHVAQVPIAARSGIWMQIADNNTNTTASWSLDGQTWVQFDSRSRTAIFAAGPTLYGPCAYPSSNAVTQVVYSILAQ